MSRSYEMEVRAGKIRKDKFNAVLDYLKKIWFEDNAEDVRMEFERGELDSGDGTVEFSIWEPGYLTGGDGEEEWAERVYTKIREINEAPCTVYG